MRRLALASATAGLILCGCATPYSLSPVGGDTVAVRYEKGRATLVSHAQQGSIRLAPLNTSYNGRMFFAVVAYNEGGTPANLGYESLRISVDGQALPLHSYEDLKHDAEVKASWGKVAIALAGGLQTVANEQAAHSYTSGHVYAGRYSAGFTTSSYDPAVALQLNRETSADMASGFGAIDAALDHKLAGLDANILRTTTIDPGQADGGVIAVDKPDLTKAAVRRVDVVVRFQGEDHAFAFYAVRAGAQAPVPLPQTLASEPEVQKTLALNSRGNNGALVPPITPTPELPTYQTVSSAPATSGESASVTSQDIHWYPAPAISLTSSSRVTQVVVTPTGGVLYGEN